MRAWEEEEKALRLPPRNSSSEEVDQSSHSGQEVPADSEHSRESEQEAGAGVLPQEEGATEGATEVEKHVTLQGRTFETYKTVC